MHDHTCPWFVIEHRPNLNRMHVFQSTERCHHAQVGFAATPPSVPPRTVRSEASVCSSAPACTSAAQPCAAVAVEAVRARLPLGESERRSVPNIDLGARFVRGQDKLLVVAETRRQLLCAHRAARVAAVRPIASPSMQTINRTDAECIAEHAQRLARPARGPCNMQQRTSETRFNLANSLCARSRAERALMIATTIPTIVVTTGH